MTLVLNDCNAVAGYNLDLVLNISEDSFTAWNSAVESGALLDALASVDGALDVVKVTVTISERVESIPTSRLMLILAQSTDRLGSHVGASVARAFAEIAPAKYMDFLSALLHRRSEWDTNILSEAILRNKIVHDIAYRVLSSSEETQTETDDNEECGCTKSCACSNGSFHASCSQNSCPPSQNYRAIGDRQHSEPTSCHCASNTCLCSPDACKCSPDSIQSKFKLEPVMNSCACAPGAVTCGCPTLGPFCSQNSCPMKQSAKDNDEWRAIAVEIERRSRVHHDFPETTSILPIVTWNGLAIEDFEPTWDFTAWERCLRTKLGV